MLFVFVFISFVRAKCVIFTALPHRFHSTLFRVCLGLFVSAMCMFIFPLAIFFSISSLFAQCVTTTLKFANEHKQSLKLDLTNKIRALQTIDVRNVHALTLRECDTQRAHETTK